MEYPIYGTYGLSPNPNGTNLIDDFSVFIAWGVQLPTYEAAGNWFVYRIETYSVTDRHTTSPLSALFYLLALIPSFRNEVLIISIRKI